MESICKANQLTNLYMIAALTFNELSMLMGHRTSTTKTLRYAFTYKLPQKRLTCLKCEIIPAESASV